jgi:hypothetical protein
LKSVSHASKKHNQPNEPRNLSINCTQIDLYLREQVRNWRDDNNWKKVGTTDIVRSSNNPKFEQTVQLQYRFESKQQLKFSVRDATNDTIIGTTTCFLGEVVGYGGFLQRSIMNRNTTHGTLDVRVETLGGGPEVVYTFAPTTENLDVDGSLGAIPIVVGSALHLAVETSGLDSNPTHGKKYGLHLGQQLMDKLHHLTLKQYVLVCSNGQKVKSPHISFDDINYTFVVNADTLCRGDMNAELKLMVYGDYQQGLLHHDELAHPLGEFTFTLGGIQQKVSHALVLNGTQTNAIGSIQYISSEPIYQQYPKFRFKKLVFSKRNMDGTYTLVHSTEAEAYGQSYMNEFKVTANKIAGGDTNRPIKIEVVACRDGTWRNQEVVGQVDLTLNTLVAHTNYPLYNFQKLGNKQMFPEYRTSGSLCFTKASSVTHYTFMDYLYGGVKIKNIFAIDFTGSNGSPDSYDSLHYHRRGDRDKLNDYQHAIISVGDVLEHYSTNGEFDVLGFGANFEGKTHHCFNCNFRKNPAVKSVDGVLDTYSTCLESVSLSGPTNFEYIIQQDRLETQCIMF